MFKMISLFYFIYCRFIANYSNLDALKTVRFIER